MITELGEINRENKIFCVFIFLKRSETVCLMTNSFYGNESWISLDNHKDTLNATWMWYSRIVWGKSRKEWAEWMWTEYKGEWQALKQYPVWFGHTARLNEAQIAKQIYKEEHKSQEEGEDWESCSMELMRCSKGRGERFRTKIRVWMCKNNGEFNVWWGIVYGVNIN